MAKLIQIIAITIIAALGICNASPVRLEKLKPSKSKFLARHEVAEQIPAQTPYPPAGIKPEIRFDLPTDEKLVAPDNTYLPPVGEPAKAYGPPARTYGPPEVNVKDEVEEVTNDEPEEQPQPGEVKPKESQPEQPKAKEPNSDETQTEEVPSEQPGKVETPQQSEEDNAIEDYTDTEAEAEEIEAEIKRVEAEEGLINPYPERIVLARSNGKLKSAKLQFATPLRRQSIVAQPIYLVNYNGQLYRLLN